LIGVPRHPGREGIIASETAVCSIEGRQGEGGVGDPRTRILKPDCTNLAAEVGKDRRERIAEPIEREVTEQKHLPPNLDWPGARLDHDMGLDIDLDTPMFAMARVAGWSAHATESPDRHRRMRPGARDLGPRERAVLSIDDRG
jgi:citrate synthase